MRKETTLQQTLESLKNEEINTWFDLGLFLDRIKEENSIVDRGKKLSNKKFKERLLEGGVAFLTFHYMVDGVTVEIGKYANYFEKNYPGIPIHYIGGTFKSKSDTLIKSEYKKHKISELKGFGEWKLYEKFFLTDLERGSEEYNSLIKAFWRETLKIVEKLGKYIEQEGLRLLYIVNFNSNPGNVSAALAMVLLSEYLEIPVINNNHDFYFEGGNSRFDKKSKDLNHGPRDFFYTNAHLGEVFSIIETIFPWESKLWLNVNINRTQTEYLIRQKGHNPARVTEIGTAVDTIQYTKNDKRRNINSFLQFEKILARYRKQLVSYSVEDVSRGELVNENNPKPILIGNKTLPINNFSTENIIFLQPTRIISRKRIEVGFSLLLRMLENPELKKRFINTPKLKITLLISGPIASGHYSYYNKLIKRFGELLKEIPEEFSDRVFLALLLGELDRNTFLKKFERPIEITDLYNIASLILLPSKTEGRGLPIIEATACGTPIFCRRYEPEEVFSEVIGEHLSEQDRLKVYEIRGRKITKEIVEKIIERVFYPHKFTEDTKHNRRIVNKRYSLESLNENIEAIVNTLYKQLLKEGVERTLASEALNDYLEKLSFKNNDLNQLIQQENRHYLPGYGRLSFMLMLKSLIDPSYFRIEQQRVKGSVFFFAKEFFKKEIDFDNVAEEKLTTFFNSVEQLFYCVDGENSIRHDHSMAYRHRNKYNYPYQRFTFQEITGIVNLLYLRIVQAAPQIKVDLSPQFFTDWNLALSQLSTSSYLAIDDRDLLIAKLKKNIPIAYFPGEFIMYELEFFALQAIRSRLNLPIEKELTEKILKEQSIKISPVYIFAQEQKLGKQLNKEEIENYIQTGTSSELKLLVKKRLIQIVSTQQLCVGIHFQQLGEEPLKILNNIRKKGGFILTNRRQAALMTDIVNVDRFHIGRVRTEIASNIMGIPVHSGYIQFVPAGMRTTLAFPTPIQTARDFHEAMKSKEYGQIVEEIGEGRLKKILIEDAEKRGSPVMHVLEGLLKNENQKQRVEYEYISGVYEDGNPYNGAIARIDLHKQEWNFKALSTKDKPKLVTEFVKDFERETGEQVSLAWNGGYILNPELVGKLGLPESYIGSPLGLLIIDGACQCPPLFNKAALMIDKKGGADIRMMNSGSGLTVRGKNWELEFQNSNYNVKNPGEEIVYYDLLYSKESIKGNGRVIIRLSGRTIKEIINTKAGEQVKIIPVGITLSIPREKLPKGLAVEQELEIEIPELGDIEHAIEAGPLLLKDGIQCIDMEAEGWKRKFSIATQAARLDYLDMRGPKIAVGMNENGELMVLTVNGRIRESVGATHIDMADILAKHGMNKAMGFDPGGSSTLVVEGKTINISPYNHNYEYNVYALPPEPRAVSNAVIGYIKQ